MEFTQSSTNGFSHSSNAYPSVPHPNNRYYPPPSGPFPYSAPPFYPYNYNYNYSYPSYGYGAENQNEQEDFKGEELKAEDYGISGLKNLKKYPNQGRSIDNTPNNKEKTISEEEYNKLFETIQILTKEKQKLEEKLDSNVQTFNEYQGKIQKVLERLETENKSLKEEFLNFKNIQVCYFKIFFNIIFNRKKLIFFFYIFLVEIK